MRKLRKTNGDRFEFCDGCSSTCDAYCRATELLQASREHVLFFGARFR